MVRVKELVRKQLGHRRDREGDDLDSEEDPSTNDEDSNGSDDGNDGNGGPPSTGTALHSLHSISISVNCVLRPFRNSSESHPFHDS